VKARVVCTSYDDRHQGLGKHSLSDVMGRAEDKPSLLQWVMYVTGHLSQREWNLIQLESIKNMTLKHRTTCPLRYKNNPPKGASRSSFTNIVCATTFLRHV